MLTPLIDTIMEAIKTIQQGNYIAKVHYDESPLNPRHFTNISHMVCFHKRYSLGDVNTNEYKFEDYNSWGDMRGDIMRRENVRMIKPLFLYDHGNISISMNDFADPWDSGQIGFIYVTNEEAEGISDDKLVAMLVNEVDEYNAYLNGEVYMYTIYEEEVCNMGCAHQQWIDGGSGYFDIDDCMSEALSQLEYYKERGILA